MNLFIKIALGIVVIAALAFGVVGTVQYNNAHPPYTGNAEIVSITKVLRSTKPIMYGCSVVVKDETGTERTISVGLISCANYVEGMAVHLTDGSIDAN